MDRQNETPKNAKNRILEHQRAFRNIQPVNELPANTQRFTIIELLGKKLKFLKWNRLFQTVIS